LSGSESLAWSLKKYIGSFLGTLDKMGIEYLAHVKHCFDFWDRKLVIKDGIVDKAHVIGVS